MGFIVLGAVFPGFVARMPRNRAEDWWLSCLVGGCMCDCEGICLMNAVPKSVSVFWVVAARQPRCPVVAVSACLNEPSRCKSQQHDAQRSAMCKDNHLRPRTEVRQHELLVERRMESINLAECPAILFVH